MNKTDAEEYTAATAAAIRNVNSSLCRPSKKPIFSEGRGR
jgi:hypothetical protein